MAAPRTHRRPSLGRRAALADAREWIGWRVDDVNGSWLGRLEDVIADEDGELAAWLVVNEFRFGQGRRFFVPAIDATAGGGSVYVPFDRDLVVRSAGLGSARHTPQAERRLRLHYLSDRPSRAA